MSQGKYRATLEVKSSGCAVSNNLIYGSSLSLSVSVKVKLRATTPPPPFSAEGGPGALVSRGDLNLGGDLKF